MLEGKLSPVQRCAPFLICTFAWFHSACGKPPEYPLAATTENGVQHATYDYAIAYQPGTQELMGSEWRLDNFAPGEEGLGVPKTTDRYMRSLALDHDGDDRVDARASTPAVDFLFNHRRNDGVVFVSSLPLSQHAEERGLDIILRNFVESASSAGHIKYDFELTSSGGPAAMASRILTSRAVTVDGFPAHEVIFEVANVQQLELTPDARWERGHLILVRPDFAFTELQYRPNTAPPRDDVPFYPVLLAIGYANHPDEFDAGHPAFADLVSRIRIGRGQSLANVTQAVANCAPDLGPVSILTRTDGFVATHSMTGDEEVDACVRRGVRRYRFRRSEWPRTYRFPQVARRTGTGTTAGRGMEPPAPAPEATPGDAPGLEGAPPPPPPAAIP